MKVKKLPVCRETAMLPSIDRRPAPACPIVLDLSLMSRFRCRADLMTGWLMKAFNVSFYDDRRLCFMEGCTPSMLAFKWDHAV